VFADDSACQLTMTVNGGLSAAVGTNARMRWPRVGEAKAHVVHHGRSPDTSRGSQSFASRKSRFVTAAASV